MFERFTDNARQVVVEAQAEARALKHAYIGTEHILLGLLKVPGGVAARVLTPVGVTADAVRERIAAIVGEGTETVSGQIPFSPRAKKTLELSLREALGLRQSFIGTEHILLGLVRENEGVAARILLDFDIDGDRVRSALAGELGVYAQAFGARHARRRFRGPRAVASIVPSHATWEYRVERRQLVEAAWLNELGAEGWELVDVCVVGEELELIFKRRRLPGSLRAAG